MKSSINHLKIIGLLASLVAVNSVKASDLTIPNQFTSGARAVAGDVNANFDAAAVAVTDNQTQLTDLIAQITALTATVTANSETIVANAATITSLETQNASLQIEVDELIAGNILLVSQVDVFEDNISANDADIIELQENSVSGLSDYLTVGLDNQGNATAIFSGVNLHINNGTGFTDIKNALGNLIVGYDEETTSTTAMCSFGAFRNAFDCSQNFETWTNIHKDGSHNLVIGKGHNYSQTGGLVAGLENSVTNDRATVTGGSNNQALGSSSSVSGGFLNAAEARRSSVSGGSSRTAFEQDDWIAGSLFEDN